MERETAGKSAGEWETGRKKGFERFTKIYKIWFVSIPMFRMAKEKGGCPNRMVYEGGGIPAYGSVRKPERETGWAVCQTLRRQAAKDC